MGILTKGEYTVTNLEDGRGISKTEVTYQKSTSGTVVPTGTWTTNIPSVGAGEYLWTRTLFTYTDNTTSSTYTVGRMGTNGNNGLGISNNNVHYQASSSGTTAPTGTWTATIPTVAANQYLWTRTTITYTDGSTSVSYSVGKMGADGKDAQLLYLTASSQVQAFDKDDKPKTTKAIIISAKLQNASGTATFVAIPYIGNTAQSTITLGGTGNDRTLLPSQWASTEWTSIAITATLGPLTDTISVVKVKDGRTPVVHTAWADSEDGRIGFTLDKPVDKIPKYKGHYVDYSIEASTDPADYKWERNPDDAGSVADDANDKSDLANQLANAAKELADKAKADAAEANRLLGLANGEIGRLNTDVSNARSELERAEAELNSQIETVETKLTQDYATKTNLSETQITLNKKISESVASVKQEMSETYAVKTDFTELSGDYASFKEDTAKKFSQQVSSIETVQTDTAAAQQMVNDALSKAQSAIANATNASSIANNALNQASNAANTANGASQNAANAIASANSAISSANTAKSNADKAIADVAALTKTVTTQSTRIDQTSSRIDQVASGVTEVGNKLDNLKLSDDNLLEKTDTSVFGIGTWSPNNNNGGGNISLDNSVKYQGRPTLKIDFTKNNIGAKNNQCITLKPDTEYYYSAVIKSNNAFGVDNSLPMHIWMHNTTATFNHAEISISYEPKIVNANEWTTVIRKFKTPKDYDTYYLYVLLYGLSGVVINVADIQVREGSKYIPWSPSRKDSQAQIDGINSNLSNNYYQKTTVDSKLSTAVSGITAQYTQDITTRLGNYYDKSTIDSKLTIDGTGISSYVKATQSQLDNLSVGGVNLIRDTDKPFSMGWGIPNTTWENGRTILRYDKGNYPSNGRSEILPQNGAFDGFVMKRGVTYTQSMIVETDANTNLNGEFNFTWYNPSIGHVYKRANVKKIGNEMYLIWCTTSVDVDNYRLRAFDTHDLKQVFYYYNSGSYIAFSKPKLEEGNTPTAWSPSPEDQQSQIDSTNSNLQNNYYTKTQTEAAISVKADSITQTVSSTYATKVNTIKTSVEEFYQSTSPTSLSGGSWSTTQPTWTQGKYIWRRTKNTYGNDSVSYSPSTNGVCITGNTGATGANGQNGKGVSSYSVTYQAGTSGTTAPTGTWSTTIPSVPQGQYLWTKMVITYTDNTSTTSYSVSYIPVNGQNGDTGATGPAGNGISSITAEFYLSTSKSTQTGGAWSTTQPTWSPGKYVWTRNKITYTNGSTAYTSPKCSSEWEAVNEIQVGGRNLLKNTANFGNSGGPSGSKDGWLRYYESTLESEKYNGLDVRSLKNVSSTKVMCDYSFTGFNLGDTYTLSFWAKGTISRFNCFFYGDIGYARATAIAVSSGGELTRDDDGRVQFLSSSISSTEWRRLFITWKLADAGDINIAKKVLIRTDGATGGDLYVCGVKLEKGNKATDWSPAPEDMATTEQAQNAQDAANNAQSTADDANSRVTVAESTIKQLSDSISMLVTDSNGSSMMTQTSDGWTFNIGAIASAIDSASNNINNLTSSMSKANNTINNLNNLANDLSKKTAYINMTTDETGAPCIELGKVGNDFKVRITNTSVDFIQGSSKIAYVSNQALFIEKAIIKNELQIGESQGFVWKTRSNGNLGLRWFSV